MATECSQGSLDFGTVAGRAVVGAFDGGVISSDGGALLLGATDAAIDLVDCFAGCFRDGRKPELIEHKVETLVGQRVVGIALGYEDLIDHDELRHDPVMAVLAGKLEAQRKECAPVAGKSTLSRLEHAPAEGEVLAPARYHKIGHDAAAIEALFVTLYLEAHDEPPGRIIIDLDATDDPLHGHQEGRFFHSARPSGATAPTSPARREVSTSTPWVDLRRSRRMEWQALCDRLCAVRPALCDEALVRPG